MRRTRLFPVSSPRPAHTASGQSQYKFLLLLFQFHLVEPRPVFAGQVDLARGGVEGDAVEHVGVGGLERKQSIFYNYWTYY